MNHLILRIPTLPRRSIYLTLRASDYHLSLINDILVKKGSVTVNGQSVSIALSKGAAKIEPQRQVGIDVNERNVTWADSAGRVEKVNTSQIAELKGCYREIRTKISKRTRNDRRVQRGLLSKYGLRESHRKIQRLHLITKKIVERADANRFGIVMERLKGIRKLYRKGNGQGNAYRSRMNSWTFREFQRQIEYKAVWVGLPVTYINPRGTSRTLTDCGSELTKLEGRRLLCPSCAKIEDRDIVASKNIMACAISQARPGRKP